MALILKLLFSLAFLGFIIGMLNPDWAIFWGDYSIKSRKNVVKYYGIPALILVIPVFLTVKVNRDFDLARKEFNDEFERKKAENKKEKELEEKNGQEKVENKEDKKSKNDTAKEDKLDLDHIYLLNPQEMLDKTDFRVKIRTASRYYIEEIEKQKVKKLNMKNIAVYSEKPIKDKQGQIFKYSFVVTGSYEEKGTASIRDFAMTIVYENDRDLENGQAACIQYVNPDTLKQLNAFDPEYDFISKILDL